jgi:flagellar motor switch protein FliN
MTRDDLIKRFVAELTRVVSAAASASASTRIVAPVDGPGFALSVRDRDGENGTLRVHFAREGAEALIQALELPAGESPDGITETLRGLASQATTSLDRRAVPADLVVESLGAEEHPASDGTDPHAVDIVLNGQERPLHLVISGDLAFVETADGRRAARSRTLDVIMDIDLPLVVRFGRTELPLRQLTTLGPGSVIDLGRSPDEPVDILISNRVVARGEVVIVSGNYGVRVRDVISPMERARSMEAEIS